MGIDGLEAIEPVIPRVSGPHWIAVEFEGDKEIPTQLPIDA